MGEEFKQNGVAGEVVTSSEISEKNKLAAALLCFFLGMTGMHRFYVGKVGTGVAILLISVIGWLLAGLIVGLFILAVSFIWAAVDFFMIIFGNFKDKDGRIISK